MGVALKILVEDFEGLGGEGGASLAFLGWLAADEVCEILHPVFVALLRLAHPPLQHRLDLLGALWRDVQLLKPRN